MWRMERIAASGLVAVLALGIVGCPPPEEPPEEPPVVEPVEPVPDEPVELPEGVTAEMVSLGREIFTGPGICFSCHGMDATGVAQLGPNLRDGVWINVPTGTLEEIEQVIRTGVPDPVQYPSPMPPMGGAALTDEQVEAVAAYVYSISR